MSEDERSLYEKAVEGGFAWQWDGPVLRNSPAYFLDRFDWGPLETIIWIATRDERSMKGALGMISGLGQRNFKEPVHQGHMAKVILETILPLDVADHHTDCPRHFGSDMPCDCDARDRIRFCRCDDRLNNGSATCRCVRESIDAFINAFRGDLTVRGRIDGGHGFDDVKPGQRVGAMLRFDREDGLRLLPAFADLRMPAEEVRRRWPADFSDKPSLGNFIAGPIPGEREVGRPATMQHEALTIFVRRAQQGHTKWPAAEEARRIALAAERAKNKGNISKWIRPYFRLLFKDKRFDTAAVAGVVAQVEADLEAARLRRVAKD